MAYMFGIDSILLRELKGHDLVDRGYTSQGISLDKDSNFSFRFRMVNISQNMECESNPCLN
ncbi:hypothetical protein GCM10010267_69810 [Streptomyces griseorubens]|nr:hypothetical protein GCM10010267_69810 [Streptomyces griseorubens]GGV46224.1 hypothetical protein GCM10010182_82680 [Actinomadura cremea]